MKTKKVGGTSFEVALSQYCSSECVITPISPNDEDVRGQLNFVGPQNFTEIDRVGLCDPASANYELRGNFANHSSLEKVRDGIGKRIVNDYCTLTIHRDPADMLISQYFFRMQGVEVHRRIPFASWYQDNKQNVIENYQIAPVKGSTSCDVVFDYTNLERDINECKLLPPDFIDTFSQLRLKGQYRDRRSLNTAAFYEAHGIDTAELTTILEPYI